MIAAHPLQWPDGWPRLESYRRKRAQFSKYKNDLSIFDGIERVFGELSKLGIIRDDVVVSTNVRTRLDGLPRSDQAAPSDPGVAVYWQEKKGKGARRVMAVDRYDRVADNLAAIAATLEAMRAIERHGGAQILERAFTGFDALPNPSKRGWREVLGIHPEAPAVSAEHIERAYRAAAMVAHPDRGGTDARMAELNAAREAALKEIRA